MITDHSACAGVRDVFEFVDMHVTILYIDELKQTLRSRTCKALDRHLQIIGILLLIKKRLAVCPRDRNILSQIVHMWIWALTLELQG